MIRLFLITLLLMSGNSTTYAQSNNSKSGLSIGTWNTKQLGIGRSRDWGKTARVLKKYDFVALQEVMAPEALIALVDTLKKITMEDWGYIITKNPVGTGKDKEYLAFIWKSNQIVYENVQNTYHNTEHRFARAPFAGRFASMDRTHRWTALNIHLTESKNREKIRQEVRFLDDYFLWAQDYISDGTPILMMGEVGLSVNDKAFTELNVIASHLLRANSTVITESKTNKHQMSNNIWEEASGGLDIKTTIADDFRRKFEMSREESINKISDRLPVKIVLGNKPYKKSAYIRPTSYKQEVKQLHILCAHPSTVDKNSLMNMSDEFIILKNGELNFDIGVNGWVLENEKGDIISLEGTIKKDRTYKIYATETGKDVLNKTSGLLILKTPINREYFRLGYNLNENKGICQI